MQIYSYFPIKIKEIAFCFVTAIKLTNVARVIQLTGVEQIERWMSAECKLSMLIANIRALDKLTKWLSCHSVSVFSTVRSNLEFF